MLMEADSALRQKKKRSERRLVLILTLPVLAYFLVIPAYALFHADLYASDTPRLIRYVLGPAALAALTAYIAFVMRRDRAIVAALSVAAIMAALFAYEAVLTVKSLSATLGQVGYVSERESVPQNVRTAMPPAYTSKALNQELGVASLGQAILGGLPDRNVLLCSRANAPVTYRADRYGYNNPDSVYEKPVDLVILGDSFVEGICLPRGQDVVSVARERIGGVVGLGTRGAGPLVELAALGRYGPLLKPKHVVIAFFAGNDWQNLEHEAQVPWLREALQEQADFGQPIPDQQLVERATAKVGEWWDQGDQSIVELLNRRSVLRNFFSLQQTSLNLGIHYPKAAHDQPILDDVLARASAIADSWGGDVTLAYIPEVSHFFGGAVADDLRSKVIAAAGRNGVAVIDLQEVFENQPDPLSLYAPDSHFSAAGAELAAETIAQNLAETNWAAGPE